MSKQHDDNIQERRENYQKASKALSQISEEEFAKIIDESQQVHSGIGGTAVKFNLGGAPVFAKQISITDLEMQDFESTKNVFKLPNHYQYGFGSAGFGSRREMESHKMTTDWVLKDECPNFPLMYGYRVMPKEKSPPLTKEQLEKREEDIKYWGGNEQVRNRLQAIDESSHKAVIILESIPMNLNQYLYKKTPESKEDSKPKVNPNSPNVAMVEHQLKSTINFMKSKGMVHFDAHHGNILTDGNQIYFSDFGLTMSKDFDLSDGEREFLDQHHSYDQSLAFTSFSWNYDESLPESVKEATNYHRPFSDKMNRFVGEFRNSPSKEEVNFPADQMESDFQSLKRFHFGLNPDSKEMVDYINSSEEWKDIQKVIGNFHQIINDPDKSQGEQIDAKGYFAICQFKILGYLSKGNEEQRHDKLEDLKAKNIFSTYFNTPDEEVSYKAIFNKTKQYSEDLRKECLGREDYPHQSALNSALAVLIKMPMYDLSLEEKDRDKALSGSCQQYAQEHLDSAKKAAYLGEKAGNGRGHIILKSAYKNFCDKPPYNKALDESVLEGDSIALQRESVEKATKLGYKYAHAELGNYAQKQGDLESAKQNYEIASEAGYVKVEKALKAISKQEFKEEKSSEVEKQEKASIEALDLAGLEKKPSPTPGKTYAQKMVSQTKDKAYEI